MNKNRYLIIGGNSFIGINITQTLLREGNYVKVFTRNSEKIPQNILKNVELLKGDLACSEDIKHALSNIDIAIYLASTSNVSTSTNNIFQDTQNIILFLNFMEIVKNCSIKRVIFASSGGTVYGEPNYLPVDENHVLKPLSPYGITKVAIENYLYFYKCRYGIDFTICRYSNPYGKHQDPFKGVGAINFFLYKHLLNKPISIYGDPAKIIRDYIYIDDLVNATILLASKSELASNIYNIGSGEGFSLQQIIQEIEILTKREVKSIYYPSKNTNVQQIVLDIKRVSTELNWKPKIDLKAGIALNKLWVEELLSI
ncbi:UDP-glucose 4-epimerase [Bacillus pseudomycoides]|nr:UDP-glucose 4-epimerase [Bacillus pseudomycoides]